MTPNYECKQMIMRKLSSFVGDKNNNFNLIRIVAASLVLFSHSFAISTGSANAEPLRLSLDVTFGTMAVDVFFVISGFLVTGSLVTRKNVLSFIWARFLRVYPALIVAIFLTVFVLGLLFSTLSPYTFFLSQETHAYLITNISFGFLSDSPNALPGVFETLPFKNVINGSLWTIVWEVRLYAALALIWLITYAGRRVRIQIFNCFIVGVALCFMITLISSHFFFPFNENFLRLSSMFFFGAVFFVLQNHIVLDRRFFFFLLLVVFASTLNKNMFFITYHLFLAYLTIFIAYIPTGRIRMFNRMGDYSYGIYIYAFPVQQSIVAIIPNISVLSEIVLSLFITLGLAIISWHLLEKQILKFKQALRN